MCEALDSYALPLEMYQQATPLREWIVKHWKYVVTNGKSLQAVNSKSYGDYALLHLKAKARGRTLQDFLNVTLHAKRGLIQISRYGYFHGLGREMKKNYWNVSVTSPRHREHAMKKVTATVKYFTP